MTDQFDRSFFINSYFFSVNCTSAKSLIPMKSLFNDETAEEIKDRINKLSPHQQALWGKMSVSQALHHCQFPLQIALQMNHPPVKPNWFAKILFKKAMYDDKPWRKNLPTVPSFRVTGQKEFDQEKSELIKLITEFNAKKDVIEWQPHPVFGKFTAQQWGQMQYKHLDHHLQQFNI